MAALRALNLGLTGSIWVPLVHLFQKSLIFKLFVWSFSPKNSIKLVFCVLVDKFAFDQAKLDEFKKSRDHKGYAEAKYLLEHAEKNVTTSFTLVWSVIYIFLARFECSIFSSRLLVSTVQKIPKKPSQKWASPIFT